ncbi:MAG: type II secretion system F family protein [Patescibacteria group bacterium]
MRFRYSAYQPDGKIVEGSIDADNQSQVLQFLGSKGLRPISVHTFEAIGNKKSGGKITLTDKIFLTKYLGLMLRVGTDLFKAIDILIEDFNKPGVKNLLLEIRSGLERGKPFHATFAQYPQYFSPVFVSLLKAGESSGGLDRTLDDLNKSLEKEGELQGKLKAAFIYPVILVVMAIGILTFLVTFALPKIADVFSGGGVEPPIFSRIVFGVGLFVGKYVWIFLGSGVALITIGFFFFRTNTGKRVFRMFLRKTPLVKNVTQKLALQRFAGTLSALLKSGLPILEALETTASAVGDDRLEKSLQRVAREGVSRGITLGEAFKKETTLPLIVTNLIAISEKAGHLDDILQTLSDFYEKEIDESVKTLVAFIEPALLIVIGLVVAMIALSIIVPIYQLVGQF